MNIAPGTIVYMRETRHLSIAEDEEPLLTLRAGDHLQATAAANNDGFQEFTHLPSGFTNIRLHCQDVCLP